MTRQAENKIKQCACGKKFINALLDTCMDCHTKKERREQKEAKAIAYDFDREIGGDLYAMYKEMEDE